MLNLFKQKSLSELKTNVINKILGNKQNQWIKSYPTMYKSIEIIINASNETHLQKLDSLNEVLILKNEGMYSCAISNLKDKNIILAFPSLIKIFKSASYLRGAAIIAHELGHLIHEHSKKNIDTLKAQIEADTYAFEVGLGEELQDFLLEFNSEESRVRVAYLTSRIVSKEKSHFV